MKKQILYASFTARMISNFIDFFLLILLSIPVAKIFKNLTINATQFASLQTIIKDAVEKHPKDSFQAISSMISDDRITSILFANGGLLKAFLLNLITLAAGGVIMICCWYFFQATPGKALMGIKLADSNDFKKPSLLQLIIRGLSSVLSAIPLMFGFVYILFSDKKQSWHDVLAKTVVIKR